MLKDIRVRPDATVSLSVLEIVDRVAVILVHVQEALDLGMVRNEREERLELRLPVGLPVREPGIVGGFESRERPRCCVRRVQRHSRQAAAMIQSGVIPALANR